MNDPQRILVTGGSRGLGRAICTTLAAAGARVAFTWSQDADGAQVTERESTARGFRASVTDVEATSWVIETLEEEWGGVDAVVNNAGISEPLPIPLLEEENWDRVMNVNVKGAWLTSRAAARGMIRRRSGVILNIGSIAGLRMVAAPVHYAASKAALAGLTRALAFELAPYGIRANCLAPGLLEGGVSAGLNADRKQAFLKHCGLQRTGTFAEVAELVGFLLSSDNTYMNGETIVMDGGL